MRGAPRDPVTAIFARRVRAGSESRYEDWLTGIAQAAARVPGSLGTTILRRGDAPGGGPGDGPGDRQGDGERDARGDAANEASGEYVAIAQFDGAPALDAWLASEERALWMSRLDAIDVCREDVSTLAGMERWFTPARDDRALPPRYKTAALVLLGLYPLVLALDVVLGPLLSGLPRPAALLLSLVVSVSIMVWWVLPWLTRVFQGWLRP